MSSGSPYVFDRALAGSDLIVGRYQLVAHAVQSAKRGRPVLLVYGPACMGKTTFLHQLAGEPEFAVVEVRWSWPVGSNADAAMRELQATISDGLAAAHSEPVGGLSAETDRQHLPLLVLLDALPAACLRGQPGVQWMTRWLDWTGSMPGVCWVVAVDGRCDGDLLANPVLACLPSMELEGLDLQDTEELLQRPARGRMTYSFDAVRRVWQLTSGHPCFVQLIGHVLFVRKSSRGRVELHDVEAAVPAVLEAAHQTMERVWQSCPPRAQVVLAVSSDLRGRHGLVTAGELQSAALNRGLKLAMPAIDGGLEELLSAGVLRRLGKEGFTFCVDLFRMWLSKNRDLSHTLESLTDRQVLVAPTGLKTWRSPRWSSLALLLLVVGIVAAAGALWGSRGPGRRLVMGSFATPTAQPPATRDASALGPAPGWIAYMAQDQPDANWDVWVMRGDGSDPERLTDDRGSDTSPVWAPDGRAIAFVSDRDGNKEVYVMKADGTQPLNLSHNRSDDWTPSWSPDGEHIAFSSYRDGNWEVYTMSSDGSEPQRLTRNNAADMGPSWSPDGQWIAFASNRDGNWEIYVMQADGNGLQRLTSDPATDFALAWSPDGATIAFESYRDGDMEIYLMATDGSDQRNVSNDHYSNEHSPAWARGGTRLLYHSNRDGGWDIFSMRQDGTEKSNLTLSPALEQSPSWHE